MLNIGQQFLYSASKAKTRQTSGFSLIELALIIAIIGILAAIMATQFIDLTGSAEKSLLQDFGQKLSSSLSSYVAQNGRFPPPGQGFEAFVAGYGPSDSAPILKSGEYIGLPMLKGTDAICTMNASTITCDRDKLVSFTATYTYANGGVQTLITPRGTTP